MTWVLPRGKVLALVAAAVLVALAGWSTHAGAVFVDSDGDGLADSVETKTGVYVSPNDTGTDPLYSDTDGDSMRDGDEVSYGFDPTNDDENENGIIDGLDDTDDDRVGNSEEIEIGTHPRNRDSDADGLSDGEELGGFGPERVIASLERGAHPLALADLDGDGDNDLIIASLKTGLVSWYENTDGLGTWGPAEDSVQVQGGVQAVRTADLDGDGDADLLCAAHRASKIFWFENEDGLGYFGAQQLIARLPYLASDVRAADLDGDGDLDVISAAGWFLREAEVAWHENIDGLGTFVAAGVITTEASAFVSVFAADLDGDADLDVLSASASKSELAWYENTDGMGAFGEQRVIGTSFGFVSAADMDGDGDIDAVGGGLGPTQWYANTDGRGNFGPGLRTGGAGGWHTIVVMDLDDDGDPDLLSGSRSFQWIENTDGKGAFGAPLPVSGRLPGESSYLVAGDLDGDGDMEALSDTDGLIASYSNDGVSDPLDPNSPRAESGLQSGRVVYTDGAAIFLVDPESGERSELTRAVGIESVDVAPDGFIVYGGIEGLFQYDAARDETTPLGGDNPVAVVDLAVGDDGEVSYTDGSTIYLLDRTSGVSVPIRTPGHSRSVDVAPDGVIYFNFHGRVRGVDPLTGAGRSHSGGAGGASIRDLAAGPNGAVAYTDGRELWRSDPGGQKQRITHAFDSGSVALTPKGEIIYNFGAEILAIGSEGTRRTLSVGDGFAPVRDLAVVP